MPSDYIGFRLESSDIELLQQHKLPKESDALAVKRLLRQMLGSENSRQQYDNYTAENNDNIRQLLDEIVKERFDKIEASTQAFIQSEIDSALKPVWEHYNELASVLISPRPVEFEPEMYPILEAIASSEPTVKDDESDDET